MSRRSLNRDIGESIRNVLGKNEKVFLKTAVKQEVKVGGEKTENRYLVLTRYRLYIMTSKIPTRIDHTFHYLDLRQIESRRSNHIILTFAGDKSNYAFRTSDPPESSIDDILSILVDMFARIFPSISIEKILSRFEIIPTDRKLQLRLEVRECGPCGGFSAQYECVCDYYGVPFREEVAWDIDTIYFSHDSHEFSLQDFEHLDHRDVICLIMALEYNTWFKKLRASTNNLRLSSDICDRLIGVVSRSISLSELHIQGSGLRSDFVVKLSQAILYNKLCSLSVLDLSCNAVEDKGMIALASAITSMTQGFCHLNLSHCGLSSKGIASINMALSGHASNLKYLNLAGNSIREEISSLCLLLSKADNLAILDLSSTEISLDLLFSALLSGCVASLTHLNLCRNAWSVNLNPSSLSFLRSRGTNDHSDEDVHSAFKNFFAMTQSLQYLNLSQTHLPSEALKNLLLGLACNTLTKNVELNLSSNNLGAAGANVIESCVGGVTCVTRLDLSDNNIEAEMAGLMIGISRSRSILSLNISRNITGVKPKHLPTVMEGIVHLLQEEESALQKLNLSDCRLRSEISTVLNALGSNQRLHHIDLCGNLMGDGGARVLAKALQINTRLRIIALDRNCISLHGYSEIAYALQSNYVLCHIPFPTFDLQPLIKTHPERVDIIWHRIQDLLQRNGRFPNTERAFRLTQGFVLGSTREALDRGAVQLQDNMDVWLRNYKNTTNELETTAKIDLAKGLISDAESTKHLLAALHQSTGHGMVESVEIQLKSMAIELREFIRSHAISSLDGMLKCAAVKCPTTFHQIIGGSNQNVDLSSVCKFKIDSCISSDFIYSLLMDKMSMEVRNKINELNLVIANIISDRFIEDVLGGMLSMGRDMCFTDDKKKRSLTPDALSSVIYENALSTSSSMTVDVSSSLVTEKFNSSADLPSKRKLQQERRLRPKIDFEERNEQPILDNNEIGGSHLRHFGKDRPKRQKNHAPSRIVVHDSKVHEAIDNFFPVDDGSKMDRESKSLSLIMIASPRHRLLSSASIITGFSCLSNSSTVDDDNDDEKDKCENSDRDVKKPSRFTNAVSNASPYQGSSRRSSFNQPISPLGSGADVTLSSSPDKNHSPVIAEIKIRQEKRLAVTPPSPNITAAHNSSSDGSPLKKLNGSGVDSIKSVLSRTPPSSNDTFLENIKLRSTCGPGSSSDLHDKSVSKGVGLASVSGGSILGLGAVSKFASIELSTNPTSLMACSSGLSSPNRAKPRPWSMVGVEARPVGPSVEKRSEIGGKTGIVRDMIKNMNKNSCGGVEDGRKGQSLPRTSVSTDTKNSSEATKVSSVLRRQPFNSRTNEDDPRILKLDDDFAFEDVVDV